MPEFHSLPALPLYSLPRRLPRFSPACAGSHLSPSPIIDPSVSLSPQIDHFSRLRICYVRSAVTQLPITNPYRTAPLFSHCTCHLASSRCPRASNKNFERPSAPPHAAACNVVTSITLFNLTASILRTKQCLLDARDTPSLSLSSPSTPSLLCIIQHLAASQICQHGILSETPMARDGSLCSRPCRRVFSHRMSL